MVGLAVEQDGPALPSHALDEPPDATHEAARGVNKAAAVGELAVNAMIDIARDAECRNHDGVAREGQLDHVPDALLRQNPHPIQRAFIVEQALQCGYCINGVIMTAKAFVDRNPNPTEEDIREALADNLCRCAMHLRIIEAVRRYAEEVRA